MTSENSVRWVCISGKKIDMNRAHRLAERFGAELIDTEPQDGNAYFRMDRNGIAYVNGDKVLFGDFTRMLPRVTGGHLAHEILLKAVGWKSGMSELYAVDATAGMGEDSFILAAAGYHVDLCEHNPVTAVLLQDALIRARSNSQLRAYAERMHLHEVDSKSYLTTLKQKPDLVYLDPMFPEKKKSAESKAKLQVLHLLEAPCSDEEELLQAAISTGAGRIVIKRPPGSAPLAGVRPSFSLERKAVRFDCIVR